MNKISILAITILVVIPLFLTSMEVKSEPTQPSILVQEFDPHNEVERELLLTIITKYQEKVPEILPNISAIDSSFLDGLIKDFIKICPDTLQEILQQCAKHNCINLLKLLLSNGLDIAQVPLDILFLAGRLKHTEFCEKLILAGIIEKGTNAALIYAICLHQTTKIKSIIKSGKTFAILLNGSSALMIAIHTYNNEAVQLLLPISNIHARDDKNWTSLMHAAYYGELGLVKLIMDEKGSSLNQHEINEALGVANQENHVEVAEFLSNYT